MATHSSTLAWRIPWTEEPGGLQSIGLQRVKHYWSDLADMLPYAWKRDRNSSQERLLSWETRVKTAKKHMEHWGQSHLRSNGRICEGLVWKEGDTEPGRSHGESRVLGHALWDMDPEHESWGYIHHDSLTGVLPPFYRQGSRSCSRIVGDTQLIAGRAALKPTVKARACSQHSSAGWVSPGRTVRSREWVPRRLILRPRQWGLSHN